MNEYKTIDGTSTFELIEKKSRFISHLKHVETEEEALDLLGAMRKEHAQARHNVYAYILRGGRARYSDDGEPAQTSGLPTYETLTHAGLFDVICVTTRYFGGTLLGTGGLVRAYTGACKGAINAAAIVTVRMCVDVEVKMTYDLYQTVQKSCESADAKIISTDFTDVVTLVARVPAEKASALADSLTNVTNGKCAISLSDPFEGIL